MTVALSFRELLSQPYVLDDRQITRFRQQGFIKLKDVATEELLTHYGEAITRVTMQHNRLRDVPMEKRSTYDKAFVQVGNLWEKDESVREFAFSKRIAGIAAQLLEVSAVRLWHDQALYKEPGGGATPWHVDLQYWPMLTDRSVTAWIPLQATPFEMGPLSFGARSHLMNIARDLEISDKSERIISDAVDKYQIEEIVEPFELGEVSFHLGWTLHRADANTTTIPRRVHTIIYMENGQRLVEPKNQYQQADWDTWCPTTSIGDEICGSKNPLL